MPATEMPMCALPRRRTRVSPDSAWPLRGRDGLTYAERLHWQDTMLQRVNERIAG